MEDTLRGKEYDLLYRSSILLHGSGGLTSGPAQHIDDSVELEWHDAPIESWNSEELKQTYGLIPPRWTSHNSYLPMKKSTAKILLGMCHPADPSSTISVSDFFATGPNAEAWVPLHQFGNVAFGADLVYKQRVLKEDDSQLNGEGQSIVQWLASRNVPWEGLAMQAVLRFRPSLEKHNQHDHMEDEDVDSHNILGFHNLTALKQALSQATISKQSYSWYTDLGEGLKTPKVTVAYRLGSQIMRRGVWELGSSEIHLEQTIVEQTVIMDVRAVQQVMLTCNI